MHAGMVRQLMNFYLNETNHYYFFTTHSNHLLDMADDKPKKCFADASGTIKDKLKFCRLILTLMDHVEWTLTDSAKELCKTIFEHIDESNNAKL
jgi:hypothetical protein